MIMKLKKTIYLFVFIFSISIGVTFGQSQKILSIGDTLSKELQISLLENPQANFKLEEFRGKWLILDFWETYCIACIAAMPRLYELQKQFEEDLNIVMVTRTGAKEVNAFQEKSTIAKGTDFKFIINDMILNQLFPHRVLPHEVWVDPMGIVRAITSAEEVNEENIKLMLGANVTELSLKREDMAWSRERMSESNAESDILFRSVLKGYDPTAPQSGWLNRGASTIWEDSVRHHMIDHAYFSNYTPIRLFYTVYMLWKNHVAGNINPNRIALEIKDPLIEKQYANADLKIPFGTPKFPYMKWENEEDHKRDNLYSYDLSLPEFISDTVVYKYIFEDLNRYFPIKARIEKRHVPVLVMTVNNEYKDKRIVKSKGGKPNTWVNDEEIKIRNYPMSMFMEKLNKMYSKIIVDETKIKDNIDITINFKNSPFLDRRQGLVLNMLTFDEEIFKSELAKFGLDLKEEKRWVEMLVIYN